MMTHAELQAEVVKLLNCTGWSYLHVRKSIGKGKRWTTTTNVVGWPDLGPCWSPRQPGRFLAIEVKVPPDWLRDDQAACLASLASAGVECFVLTEKPHASTGIAGVDVADLFGSLPTILTRRR